MRAKDRQKPSFFTTDEVCMRFSLNRGIYSYLLAWTESICAYIPLMQCAGTDDGPFGQSEIGGGGHMTASFDDPRLAVL